MIFGLTLARGGSRRLPGKNVRLFCGHPLIAWAIVQLRTAHCIDTVYLTTDDDEIAEIGEHYGAEIIRRPDWPDADMVGAGRPISHALQTLIDRGEIKDDDISVHKLPTSPIVKPGQIDQIVAFFQRRRSKTAGTFIKQRETAIAKVLEWDVARWEIWDKKYRYCIEGPQINVCTPTFYLDTAGKIVDDHDSVTDDRVGWGDAAREFQVGLWAEPWQAFEVDTADEFALAEVVMEHMILKGRGMEVYEEYKRG